MVIVSLHGNKNTKPHSFLFLLVFFFKELTGRIDWMTSEGKGKITIHFDFLRGFNILWRGFFSSFIFKESPL